MAVFPSFVGSDSPHPCCTLLWKISIASMLAKALTAFQIFISHEDSIGNAGSAAAIVDHETLHLFRNICLWTDSNLLKK